MGRNDRQAESSVVAVELIISQPIRIVPHNSTASSLGFADHAQGVPGMLGHLLILSGLDELLVTGPGKDRLRAFRTELYACCCVDRVIQRWVGS